jgi:hypothetical protein
VFGVTPLTNAQPLSTQIIPPVSAPVFFMGDGLHFAGFAGKLAALMLVPRHWLARICQSGLLKKKDTLRWWLNETTIFFPDPRYLIHTEPFLLTWFILHTSQVPAAAEQVEF